MEVETSVYYDLYLDVPPRPHIAHIIAMAFRSRRDLECVQWFKGVMTGLAHWLVSIVYMWVMKCPFLGVGDITQKTYREREACFAASRLFIQGLLSLCCAPLPCYPALEPANYVLKPLLTVG